MEVITSLDFYGENRSDIIESFIDACSRRVAELRKTCSLDNMWMIDALWNARQEARLLLDLDKAGVAGRLKELAELKPENEWEERTKESSLSTIRTIGRKFLLTRTGGAVNS